MSTKVIGGVLLIIGTSIGAGMLALPIATAQGGFLGALLLLVCSWLAMTFGAFLILEVNLWLPEDSNLVSMARATLGPIGAAATWFFYLLLLYALVSAYISGGSDVFQSLFEIVSGRILPEWLAATLFLLLLGSIVYTGIKWVDYANRVLMIFKLLAFILLTAFIAPKIDFVKLQLFHSKYLISAVTVVITSFGFATIIPSLRSYFNSDVKKLRQVIFFGSFIPLLCYIVWVAVVLGNLPLEGEYGLLAILESGHSTSMLTDALIFYAGGHWINATTRFFTSICVFTSFLGVSLCLADFLADGLHLKKKGLQNLIVHGATFLPPFIIVLIYPSAFIMALSEAGVFCAVLLMLLPALMAWRGRYHQKIQAAYRARGGKISLILLMIAAIFVIIQEILIDIHFLK